jgi:hypothetical protein
MLSRRDLLRTSLSAVGVYGLSTVRLCRAHAFSQFLLRFYVNFEPHFTPLVYYRNKSIFVSNASSISKRKSLTNETNSQNYFHIYSVSMDMVYFMTSCPGHFLEMSTAYQWHEEN